MAEAEIIEGRAEYPPDRGRDVEGPKFRLWFAPNLSPEEFLEAASAICRILIDPPQSPKRRRAPQRRARSGRKGCQRGSLGNIAYEIDGSVSV
jgi:hypothetical protein